MVESLAEHYGDEVQIVYRHFPLISIHDKAQITAEAAEAAGTQGKFWEMHDIIFKRQGEWSAKSEAAMFELLPVYAAEAGVPDIEQFTQELTNRTYQEKVTASYNTASEAGLPGTPSFIVNQVDYPSSSFGLSPDSLETFIKLLDLREIWYEKPEQVIDPAKEYLATIETEKGNIVIELYPDTAPVNVNSFVFLAQKGWYKGTTFHRVLDGFVAQGGDPTGTGIGFPGYRCEDEITPSRTFDGAGIVSLANSGPNTNGSQFFITYDATPNLNANFTIIGRVIEGQEVADSLTRRDPNQTLQPPGDRIINITVVEKS